MTTYEKTNDNIFVSVIAILGSQLKIIYFIFI